MEHQRLYELIARKLSGEANAAELQELQQHLQEQPADQYLYEMIATWWSQHAELVQNEDAQEEDSFQRILQAANTPSMAAYPLTSDSAANNNADNTDANVVVHEFAPVKKFYQQKWFRYAAVVAALAGLTALLWPFLFPPSPPNKTVASQLNEVRAQSGNKSKLVLPDGTQVWLNGDSKLTYPGNFKQPYREVTLEGEAFFDVSHDTAHPFIVHTAGIDIRVLGTAFNVKSYQADATIEATLLRGSIEVAWPSDKTAPKIVLRPHEKLVVNKSPEPGNTTPREKDTAGLSSLRAIPFYIVPVPGNRPDSTMKETSWLYNKLIFEGDTFSEVAEKMQRWYNVHITIRDEQLRHLRLKGSFEKETVREALEALQLTAPFEFTITGNEIMIERKE